MVDYGSGVAGPWQGGSNSVSSSTIINQVISQNGIFMFGDSISVSTGRDLAVMMSAATGDSMAVNNWSSRPTTPSVDALQDWVTTYGAPNRILMATGSNDIFSPPAMDAQIDRTMNIVGPTRRVFWVDVQVSRWNYSAAIQLADQRNTGWVNTQLHGATERWPNLTIIPWNYWLASNPARLTMYLSDGVHCTLPGAPYNGAAFRNTIIKDVLVDAG